MSRSTSRHTREMTDRDDLVDRTLGRYRILERLGAGGMGVVYRARDERLDRDVALKVLPPGRLADEDARRRFRKEALALSRINHPQIATIHDFDNDAGVDFLVMEYIPGKGLDQVIAEGSLSDEAIRELGTQLADGLSRAAPARHGASRPQARQLAVDSGWAPQDSRFRPRPPVAAGDEPDHRNLRQRGRVRRHAALYGARADQGRGNRPAHRHLCGRRGAVRAGHRASVVSRGGPGRAGRRHPGPDAGQTEIDQSRLSDSLERTIVRALAKDPTSRPATALDLRGALAQRADLPLTDQAREPHRENAVRRLG